MFFDMVGTYKQRKVKNYTAKDVIVDTARVTDSIKPFETGIKCKHYYSNYWIIVELYNTKELAIKGHDKWVKKMTGKKLPESLKDVSTGSVVEFVEMISGKLNKIHKKESDA